MSSVGLVYYIVWVCFCRRSGMASLPFVMPQPHSAMRVQYCTSSSSFSLLNLGGGPRVGRHPFTCRWRVVFGSPCFAAARRTDIPARMSLMAAQSFPEFPRSAMTWAAVSRWGARKKREYVSLPPIHFTITCRSTERSQGESDTHLRCSRRDCAKWDRQKKKKTGQNVATVGIKRRRLRATPARREKPAKGSEQLPSHRSVVIELLRLEVKRCSHQMASATALLPKAKECLPLVGDALFLAAGLERDFLEEIFFPPFRVLQKKFQSPGNKEELPT